MGPIKALSTAVVKTFTFSGRASRSEYWWYSLAAFLGTIVAILIDMSAMVTRAQEVGELAVSDIGLSDLVTPWIALLFWLPMISLSVRRLHDAGFSGLWYLLNLIPFGAIALLIMYVLPSQNSTTVYGTPAAGPVVDRTGKPLTVDAHKRAMQGYALLLDKDKRPSPEQQAARKAEIGDYYRTHVLKSAPQA